MKILLIILLLPPALFLLQACSTQGWYEGMRDSQRQECYRLISTSEINQCLERVDGKSYDQYRQERDAHAQE